MKNNNKEKKKSNVPYYIPTCFHSHESPFRHDDNPYNNNPRNPRRHWVLYDLYDDTFFVMISLTMILLLFIIIVTIFVVISTVLPFMIIVITTIAFFEVRIIILIVEILVFFYTRLTFFTS